MGIESTAALKPHEVARNDIEKWRGHCLDFFAKCERHIGRALQALHASPKFETVVKLRHLAGQRADDMAQLLSECGLTPKEFKAVSDALLTWRSFEEPRNFLAHGVLTITLDPQGKPFAIFDMTVFRANAAEQKRWTVSHAEVVEWEIVWRKSGQDLAQRLGQLRKKFGDVSAA